VSILLGICSLLDTLNLSLVFLFRYIFSILDTEESFSFDAKILGQAVCSHWGVENPLHWVLDITFAEDKSRIIRTMPSQLCPTQGFSN
jgi:hypothetical protein